MLMLTSRRALKQQNLDHNTLSRMLGTLGAGVSSDLRTAEIHSPALWPHVVTRLVGSESATHTHTQSGHSKLLKNRSSVCVRMTCFSHDSWLFPVTADKLTLGATVADGGHFLQRNVSFWLFSYCPPGQVTHLGKIEEAKPRKFHLFTINQVKLYCHFDMRWPWQHPDFNISKVTPTCYFLQKCIRSLLHVHL